MLQTLAMGTNSHSRNLQQLSALNSKANALTAMAFAE